MLLADLDSAMTQGSFTSRAANTATSVVRLQLRKKAGLYRYPRVEREERQVSARNGGYALSQPDVDDPDVGIRRSRPTNTAGPWRSICLRAR